MIWDAFQGIGALAGLFSGAFLVWERLVKDWPTAWVVAAPLGGFGVPVSYLHLANRSDRPIVVMWSTSDDPGIIRLAPDHSIRGTLMAVMEGERAIAIDGNAFHRFSLFTPSNYDELDDEGSIEITLRWKFAQPSIWKRDRRILVRIQKRELKLLLQENEGQLTD